MADSAKKQEHGPQVAGYDNLGQALFGHVRPFMECLCGFQTGRGHTCWMTVGDEFDDHLEATDGR